MLIERADIHFPVIVDDTGNACRRYDVKREVLPLAAWDIRMAVDSPGADTAGNIRNESRVWLNEVVAKTNIESEVVILDSFENRLRDRADIKLMIASEPAITSNDSPSDALC